MPRRAPKYTESEKMQIVARVQAGESKASVGRLYGLPESTLRGWCKAVEGPPSLLKPSVSSGSLTAKSSSGDSSFEDDGLHATIRKRVCVDDDGLHAMKRRCIDGDGYDYASQWLGSQWVPHGGAVYLTPPVLNTDPYLYAPAVQFNGGPLPQLDGLVNVSPKLEINWLYQDYQVAQEPEALDLRRTETTIEEALHHGEKFLEWLTSCKDPRVTQFNAHQVRKIINNLKKNDHPR